MKFSPGCGCCGVPCPSCLTGFQPEDLSMTLTGVAAGCADCPNFDGSYLLHSIGSCNYLSDAFELPGLFGSPGCTTVYYGQWNYGISFGLLDLRLNISDNPVTGLGGAVLVRFRRDLNLSPFDCTGEYTIPIFNSTEAGILKPGCIWTVAEAVVAP